MIVVYEWMREETPLAEFASVLDGVNKENALERVRAAELQQFRG